MKYTFLFTVLITANVFGFTNLKFTPDTISMGSSTLITGNFSKIGDSSDILLFLDDNDNGTFDMGTEILIYDSKKDGEKFVDGVGDDSVADGLIYINLEAGSGGEGGAFPFPGLYKIIITDNGGGDTAGILVKPGSVTNTSVSGTVSGPAGPLANIAVYAGADLGDNDKFQVVARSGSDGTYTLYLPDSLQNKKCYVGAADEFHVLTGTPLLPPGPIDTVLPASITGLNFVFLAATQFIAGTVVDEKGAQVNDVVLWLRNNDNDDGYSIRTDSTGKFSAPIRKGEWDINFDRQEDGDEYMYTNTKVSVTSQDDTIKVTYVLFTADTTINGTVIDSAGIDLKRNFGLNINVDTTGQWNDWNAGVWYSAKANVSPGGGFSIPVSSHFSRYTLNTWVDDLPQGYFVTPNYIDSIGPGQSGILIKIAKGDKAIRLTVTDEADAPLKNTKVSLRNKNWNEIKGVTDTNGVVVLAVGAEEWRPRVDDNRYLNQEDAEGIEVTSTDDTVTSTYVVLSADTTISGRIIGDLSGLKEEVLVYATHKGDSAKPSYFNSVSVDTNGEFSLPVSSTLDGYYVTLDESNELKGYDIVPSQRDTNYLYGNVPAGKDSVVFLVTKPSGLIYGKLNMTFPANVTDVFVLAIDSLTGKIAFAKIQNDHTYGIPVSNGTYSVSGGYLTATPDTVFFIVSGVVINNNDVEINFTDSGGVVVPIQLNPIQNALVFSLRNFPNPFKVTTTIAFSTPVNGKATLTLYDLNGRLLATLFSGMVKSGTYQVPLHTDRTGYQCKSGYLIARLTILGEKNYVKNIKLLQIR